MVVNDVYTCSIDPFRLNPFFMWNPASLFVISRVTSEVFNEDNPPMDWADAGKKKKFMVVNDLSIHVALIHFGLPNFLCDVMIYDVTYEKAFLFRTKRSAAR